MLRSIQDGFQDVHFKFTVRLLMAEDIQNALPAAITVIRICDLSGQNFRTGAFFIAKLVYMAGYDHFPKVGRRPLSAYRSITGTLQMRPAARMSSL